MIQTIALKKYDWLFVLVLSIAIVCFFYGEVILSPNHVLFNSTTGDGLKNYYTASYFINHNDSWTNFEGMNYPYGESITYTDGHPLLSYLLKSIASFIPSIGNYTVAVINLLMLASFPITSLILLAIFRHLEIKPLLAILSAVSLSFLAPQVLRLWAGHYALSYSFCIPLTILLLLKVESKNWKIYSLLAVQTLVWFMTHTYLDLMASGMITLYGILLFILYFKKPDGKLHAGLTVLSGVVPLLLFLVFMTAIDLHTNRPTNPVGLFEFKAQFESIFIPHNGFLGSPAVYFGDSDFNWEGHSYIGIVSIIFLLTFLIKSITESIAKKQFILFNAWLADNRLKLLVLLSIPFLLHSMLIPFKWNLESWMDFMPFVKQFRAPGRFSWVFFFVITICTVYALDQMIQSIKNKYIQFTIIIAVAFLYFAEGVHNLHTVATSFVNTNEAFLYLDKESPLSKLSRNVQADKYQAIVSLPYHHVGSDVYVKHVNTQNSLKPSLQLSHELGLPLLSIHLTRTSLTEATNLLQLFSSDYEKRDIVSDFKSTKPFLVFFTGEELTKKEQTILSKAKTIQIEDDRVLAELEFTDLF